MCRLGPHPPLLGVWFAVAVFGCNSGKKIFTQLKLASWRNHRIHPNSRPCNSMSSHVPVSVNQFPTSTVFPVEFHRVSSISTRPDATPKGLVPTLQVRTQTLMTWTSPVMKSMGIALLRVACGLTSLNGPCEGKDSIVNWKKRCKKKVESLVWKKRWTRNWIGDSSFEYGSPWCVLFCLFCLVWMVIMLSTQRPVIVLIYHLHIPERSSFVSSFWPWVPKQCDRLSEEREDFIMTGNRRKKASFHRKVLKLLFYTLFIPFLWVSSFVG